MQALIANASRGAQGPANLQGVGHDYQLHQATEVGASGRTGTDELKAMVLASGGSGAGQAGYRKGDTYMNLPGTGSGNNPSQVQCVMQCMMQRGGAVRGAVGWRRG